MIVKAKAIKEIYKGQNDFRVVAFSPIGKCDGLKINKQYFNFSCSGSNFPYVVIGGEYDLELEYANDPKYPEGYIIKSCPSMDKLDFSNLTREESFGIMKEVTSSDRIANNCLDAYEDFIEIMLTKGKDAIDTDLIKGVGRSFISAYERIINERYKYYHVLKKYTDYEIDTNNCRTLFAKYSDEDTINKEFEKNPYNVLIEILEYSFFKADKMILEHNPKLRNSKIRCEALIVQILRRNESDGNSRIHGNIVYYHMKNDYNVPELLPLMKEVSTNSEFIYYDDKNNNLSLMSTYLGECKIAEFVLDRIINSKSLDIDYTKYKQIKDGELTEEQSNILKTECESSIAVINAKGGTGKTSVLMATIEMLEDNDLTYTLLSPTGRVAQRIKEQTSRNASTIHRRCLCGSIETDVIIVEEASMLSIDLLCMLINAIDNKDVRIYFNMDLGQIPPIGVGCPLRDMIKSGLVPTCSLTKVFRYGEGGLYKMATDAYNMEFYLQDLDYQNQDRIKVGAKGDYTYVKFNGKVEQILEEYKKFYDRKIKPEDIAVITPWGVTDFGSVQLNNKIQELVNPPKPNEKSITRKYIRQTTTKRYEYNITYRIGDLILNTKNNYKILTYSGYKMLKENTILRMEDVDTSTIMNGEIGKIVDIEDGYIIAKFNEELLVFDKMAQRELLHGFAMTSFKLQGSECPYVITLIIPQFENTLNKNISYTDMSRARKEVVEIIDPNTLMNIIGIDATDLRDTNLQELLIERMN